MRLITLFLALFAGTAIAQETPPNIVLILSDDQSWTDYSFMGHEHIETPHLDKLAKRSAVFTRGYVPTALCRPSLMTLATGLYVHQHKTSGNDPTPIKNMAPRGGKKGKGKGKGKTAGPTPEQQEAAKTYADLREKLISHVDQHPTIPRVLGEKGYLSHQSGKWWEGSYKRGGFTHGMTRGHPEPGGRHGDDGLKIGRTGMEPVTNFIDMAVAEKKPFYMWYAPFLPHTPHNPPERLFKKYKDKGVESDHVARYYAMCEWFDETCGQLLQMIDEQGHRENTLVVYVCDNGWIQDPDRNGYAPRSKQTPYEGGIRTPIMFRWPGKIPPAERDELASSIDIFPTILAATNSAVPEGLPGLN
ncbi:MAG: sulfatase-like hydrolase/transferase, partial [Verrucomicrobiales bacterium]|nr:sulfatase-like hydrolase/transferase [Verrucomicrobiales bacterium]